jgi:hypothetical protein
VAMGKFVRSGIVVVGLGLGLGLGACFVESAQPGTFRFDCSTTEDCNIGEVCSDGLCQTPCGASEEACPGATVCLNGFCSSLCPTNEDVCPSPQECVSLSPVMDEVEDEAEAGTGVCTVLCDDVDHPCAEGQLCLAGFCATTCESVEDCGSGEECLEVAPGLSVCAPSDSSGGSFP